jgi:hypothetical protein
LSDPAGINDVDEDDDDEDDDDEDEVDSEFNDDDLNGSKTSRSTITSHCSPPSRTEKMETKSNRIRNKKKKKKKKKTNTDSDTIVRACAGARRPTTTIRATAAGDRLAAAARTIAAASFTTTLDQSTNKELSRIDLSLLPWRFVPSGGGRVVGQHDHKVVQRQHASHRHESLLCWRSTVESAIAVVARFHNRTKMVQNGVVFTIDSGVVVIIAECKTTKYP